MLASAVPATSLVVPQQAPIGTAVDFTVGFSNTSPGQAGYGPHVDLELPRVGADGNDGITFGSATDLGAAVTATVLTFDASGHARHPCAEDTPATATTRRTTQASSAPRPPPRSRRRS